MAEPRSTRAPQGMESRRRLLLSGAAAAVLAASGLPLAAQARARGGRLRVALADGRAQDNWDTRMRPSGFITVAGAGAVFDTLTEIAADGSLRGELATDWASNADATRWRITLRAGARFHDGAPLLAQDVAASLARHKQGVLADVDTLSAPASDVLQISLRDGDPDLPWRLADPALIIHRAQDLAAGTPPANGTGLYRVTAFQPGQRLLAQRVAKHYKDGRAGWFDEVELLSLPDPAQRLEALKTGRVDVAQDLCPEAAGDLAGDRRFATHILNPSGYLVVENRRADAALAAALASHDAGVAGGPVRVALQPGLGLAGARAMAQLARDLRAGGFQPSLTPALGDADLVARQVASPPAEDGTNHVVLGALSSVLIYRRDLEFADSPDRAPDPDGGRIAERWWRA